MYLTKTEIINKPEWTKSLVESFLGAPDKLHKMRGHTNPANLYLADRVAQIEATEAFKIAVNKSIPRRISSKLAADKKRENLLKQVADMPIKLSSSCGALTSVINQAISDYNCWNTLSISLGDIEKASLDSSPDFLNRITVNFIRHTRMDYDKDLETLIGKTGVIDAVNLLRKRVYAVISDSYKSLEQECIDQLNSRWICK
jgi:hypothetical protein